MYAAKKHGNNTPVPPKLSRLITLAMAIGNTNAAGRAAFSDDIILNSFMEAWRVRRDTSLRQRQP